jgi:hypothetical protein
MTVTINTLWNEGGPSGKGYSEVEAYLRCPKEYQYAKVRGIGKPAGQMPDHFAIGSFLHAGRARWLASKCVVSDEVWQQMRADITRTRESFPLPCSDLAETTALRYLQEYVDHWSVREKPNVVAVEHMLGPAPLFDDEPGTERTARLDDFGFYPEAGGKLCIGECKSTSAPISDVANQYTLHGQPYLQKILWDLAPQGAALFGQVSGMVLDVVQKGYGGKRCNFARLYVPYEERVQKWFRFQLGRALVERSAITATSPAERRITSCTRLIGKARVACEFRDLCQHGKAGSLGFTDQEGKLISQWQASESNVIAPWE